jgi:hypothetical protein
MNYDDEEEMRDFAEWITSANKVVILTVNPRFQHSAYIVNSERGNWHDHGTVWYSNHDWQPYYGTNYGTSSLIKAATRGLIRDWSWTDDAARGVDEEFICPACQSDVDVEREARLCIACHLCLDCLDTWDDCVCWSPGNRATSGPHGAVEVIDAIDCGADDEPTSEADAAARANAAVLDAIDDTEAGAAAAADMAREGLFMLPVADPRPGDVLAPYALD